MAAVPSAWWVTGPRMAMGVLGVPVMAGVLGLAMAGPSRRTSALLVALMALAVLVLLPVAEPVTPCGSPGPRCASGGGLAPYVSAPASMGTVSPPNPTHIDVHKG